MTDNFKEYTAAYAKYFNDDFDRAFYMKWIRGAQPNQRTPLAFENYIINSPEHAAKIRADFKRVYSYFIEPNCPSTVYNDFAAKYGGHVGRNSIVNDAIIMAYVKELPVFATKYTEVIKRLYFMVNDEYIADNLLDLYLKKFRESDAYTLDDLNDDIMAGRAPTILASAKGNLNVLQDIKAKWAKMHGGAPTSHTLNILLSQIGDADVVLYTLIQQFNVFRNARVKDVQDRFLQVYGREASVPEFLKIVEQRIDDLEAMHTSHEKNLIIVKDLYKRYTASDIAEIDYIKRYIYLVDDEGYSDDIIKELIESDVYEREMRGVIRTAYKGLFGVSLPAEDETYMYEQIKGKRLHLKASQIGEIIGALKSETDKYLDALAAIFSEILVRTPDTFECVHYKQLYRDDHDSTKTDERVRVDLYASLEYHDVLKTKIKDFYETHAEAAGPLLPSKLFALLNKVLRNEELMKDPASWTADVLLTHYT